MHTKIPDANVPYIKWHGTTWTVGLLHPWVKNTVLDVKLGGCEGPGTLRADCSNVVVVFVLVVAVIVVYSQNPLLL